MLVDFNFPKWQVKPASNDETQSLFAAVVDENNHIICFIYNDGRDKANLIAAAPDLASCAQKLINQIPDTVLDEMRSTWGNSQVASITDARNNLKLALLAAMDMEEKPNMATGNLNQDANTETRFCAWYLDEKRLYWWDALWGNHNSGNGYIGMAPYGMGRDNEHNRGNMTLIDPDNCIILPYREDYTAEYLATLFSNTQIQNQI